MKIYKISQTVNIDYDTYDSAIVIANNEEEAKRICPSNNYEAGENDHWYFLYANGTKKDEGEFPEFFAWCAIKDVKVKYIGEADKKYTKKQIICASFNAG